MRGKAQAEQVRRFLNGITPAYAGKRTKSSRCPPRMWDHPRVCGEKNLCILRRVEIPGSPPRMRGKAPTKTGCSCPGGITPAYAGKRREDCDMGMYDRDHPRVCGEKGHAGRQKLPRLGSPPRMRGKVLQYAKEEHGIEDHPRVCGEKPGPALSQRPPPGSPPRMRGKDQANDSTSSPWGITPAYAGKSGLVCPRRAVWGGSPPRMRGKVVLFFEVGDHAGITPAYAGKSSCTLRFMCNVKDHPRVCGEKVHDPH